MQKCVETARPLLTLFAFFPTQWCKPLSRRLLSSFADMTIQTGQHVQCAMGAAAASLSLCACLGARLSETQVRWL